MAEAPLVPSAVAPSAATMGLLNYITATSLDADYAHVAQNREVRAARARRPGRGALVTAALFGLLVATAAVQTARNASVAEESHASLVDQVNDGRKALTQARADLASVQAELDAARNADQKARDLATAEENQLNRQGVAAGAVPVHGPGVRMVADDAPGATSDEQLVQDKDLRNIVNGLWAAGAEAIAINGQRLTALSAIRVAGTIITVNYENVAPPYTISAIGDPKTMPARFVESTTGSYWLNVKEQFGLRFTTTTVDSLTLPAVQPKRLQLVEAKNKASQAEGVS
jgi:uncharacterized protein YlxW (UPF0749 family)